MTEQASLEHGVPYSKLGRRRYWLEEAQRKLKGGLHVGKLWGKEEVIIIIIIKDDVTCLTRTLINCVVRLR